jgi:hypothetical protein
LFERFESQMSLATSYGQSTTSRFHFDLFFKTFGDSLDFSSLSRHSFLHEALVANSKCPKAMEIMVAYLSKLTRNKPFFWKLEGKGELPRSLVSPSPKQYRIKFYRKEDLNDLLRLEQQLQQVVVDGDRLVDDCWRKTTLAACSDEDDATITKLKGIQRSLLISKAVGEEDFEQAEFSNINRKLAQHSIRTTRDFNLYVVEVRKRIITQLSTKRYFNPAMNRNGFYTSLPIGMQLLEEEQQTDDSC